MAGLAGLTWLTGLTGLTWLTAGAGCTAGTTGAARAGRPTGAGCPAIAAVAAVSTGSTLTTGTAIATLAAVPATARATEEGRAVDGIDVVDHAGVGDGRGGHRHRRRSQKDTGGGRTEASRMPTICSRVARLAVSLSVEVSHFSASCRGRRAIAGGSAPVFVGYVHNLLSWVIWESKSCRNGS
jgi:hypothetical protein